MLKLMRDSFQHLKWILVFIVFLFVAYVFVGWGSGGATGRNGSQNYAARVNGDIVSLQDYQRELYYTEQRYTQMYGQPLTEEMKQTLNLNRQVLDSLVDQKLMLQEAERLELDARPQEIRSRILEIPDLNPNGKFVGSDLYARWLTSRGSTPAEFERELGRSVTIAKLESALMNSIVIPDATVEREYRRRNENAQIKYVLASADQYVNAVSVTPAEVEQYYRAHMTRFAHPEQRKINYLFADVAAIQAQMKVSEQELRAAYDKNRETYKSGEQVRAQHILIRLAPSATPAEDATAKQKASELVAKLRGGADFAATAKANSSDPGSAANGGDLGFFGKGQMVPEFENAAFSLPIGQISDPIKSQFGYHIIKVNEKRPAGYRTFEEVRPELEQSLLSERARTEARNRILQARARVEQVRPVTEEALRAAATNGVTFNTAPFFGRNDAIEGLGRVPALTEWAFSTKQGKLGEVTDTQRGPIVPFLRDTRVAGSSPLDEVRQRAEYETKLEKGRALAANALRSALAGAANIDAVAAKLGAKVSDSTVQKDGYVTGLSGDVDALINAAMTGQIGQLTGPITVEQGAVATVVTERKTFDAADFAKQKESLRASLRQNEAMRLRSALLERLKKSAQLEVNERLVTNTPDQDQNPVG